MSDGTRLRKIGTVEILQLRVYPLDAEGRDDFRTTVVVGPGTYDVYREGMTTFWMMTGQVNRRGFERLGDGMFSIVQGDVSSGIEVQFPSKRFGPDEWQAFLAEPVCTDGHPEQRLHFRLEQPASA